MEKQNDRELQASQKAQGVWERRTGDRRLGQNQLFGSFRVNPGVRALNQSDPTDDALAAIASILNKSLETPHKPPDTPSEQPAGEAVKEPELSAAEEVPVAPEPFQPAAVDDDTYVRYGPGPLDSIRLKWTTRSVGDGTYFIDETIGDSSSAVTFGPMPKQEAVSFIEGRERDAQRRFDALKNEMMGSGAAAIITRRDGTAEG
jgi:hypothetical protein